MKIEESWRIEVLTAIEEFEMLRELNSSLDREYIFCRENPVRRYLLSHYSSEDLKSLFETYHSYIEKYIFLLANIVVESCRALGLYRKPISLSLLKILIEKSIVVVQIEKRNRRGPKKRKLANSLY